MTVLPNRLDPVSAHKPKAAHRKAGACIRMGLCRGAIAEKIAFAAANGARTRPAQSLEGHVDFAAVAPARREFSSKAQHFDGPHRPEGRRKAPGTQLACVATLLGVGLGFFLRTSAAKAADWPMARGNPQLTGVTSESLPDALALKWTFKTSAEVRSSAAISGGWVYIGSSDSNVYCLSLADGKKRWAFHANAAVEASPLFLDGRIYIGSDGADFHCLNADDGRLVWRQPLEGKTLSGANWLATPEGKKRIVTGSCDFKLRSFDARTGAPQWVFVTGNYIVGSPALGDGITAFGGCDGKIHVVNALNGRGIRQIDEGAYIAASGALSDGRLYVGNYDNEFLCVDLKAGKIDWTYRDRPFPYFSSPAVTADAVVFGGRDKRVHCLRRGAGDAKWTFSTQGKVDSSPVVAGDKIVVGSDDGRLYLLALADGREIWSADLGKPIQSSPAVADGRVVVGASDGVIYAFGAP